jgi:hypothetical protein
MSKPTDDISGVKPISCVKQPISESLDKIFDAYYSSFEDDEDDEDSLEDGEIRYYEESSDDDIQYSQKCSMCSNLLYGGEDVVHHPKKKYHVIHKTCANMLISL